MSVERKWRRLVERGWIVDVGLVTAPPEMSANSGQWFVRVQEHQYAGNSYFAYDPNLSTAFDLVSEQTGGLAARRWVPA